MSESTVDRIAEIQRHRVRARALLQNLYHDLSVSKAANAPADGVWEFWERLESDAREAADSVDQIVEILRRLKRESV